MSEKDTLTLREEIQKHLENLVNSIGSRPVGSAENARARMYIADYIQNLGLHPYFHETSTVFRKPAQWSCILHQALTSESLSILPALGTLEAHCSNIQVMSHIYERKEDFERYPPARNSLVLVSLGFLHEADACRLAKPAAAVAWFRKGHRGLYSGNCIRNESDPEVPGFAITYEDAQKVLTPGIFIDLTIEVTNEKVNARDLIVDVGDITGHPCFMTHYDSRPFSPGANDNASGVACLLGILSLWPNERPARFIFFDSEEIGSPSAFAYLQSLQSEQKLNEISCIINPDSVGLGELYLHTADRFGVFPEKLIACARDAFYRHHWQISERTARSGTSDYADFHRAGVPCLFLSDSPNEVRHTTEDVLGNIKVDVLVQLAKVLAQEAFYEAISR